MTPKALKELLTEVAKKWGVPGAQLYVGGASESIFVSTGFANMASKIEVIETTQFQLGSTTKPMVAFMAHRLAEDGMIDLDASVTRYLTEAPDAIGDKLSNITIRQLMSHQSGLSGDAFFDLGDDFDAERRLITEASELPIVHAPGEDVSYCNFGYVLLGQILEQAIGKHWTTLFKEHVAAQFETTTLEPWPTASADDRAIGHANGTPVQRVALPASNAAAGTTLVGTARDLGRFGHLVLDSLRGTGPISRSSARKMITLTRSLAPNERGLGFGQGLMVFQKAPLVFGHDGLTTGQQAYLRVFEESGATLAFLGNGGDMRSAIADLLSELTLETGSDVPPPDIPDGNSGQIEPGLFARANASIEISVSASGPHLTIINHEPWAADLYGDREGPFALVALPNGGAGFYKSASATPFRVHVSGDAAYLGMRRYNRAVRPA